MPLRKHELFTRSKCPDGLPWGHSPGRPGRTQLGDRRSPAPGSSSHFVQRREERLRVSRWAARGPAASGRFQPARSCLLGREASGITPSARRTGRGAGESQASEGRSSGLPPRRGDTRGTPGLPRAVYPASVDSCEPSGEVPRRPRRPESCEPQPSRAGAGSASSGWSSRRAGAARRPSREPERPRGGERSPAPRAPRAQRPCPLLPLPLLPPGRAAALPGAE